MLGKLLIVSEVRAWQAMQNPVRSVLAMSRMLEDSGSLHVTESLPTRDRTEPEFEKIRSQMKERF